MGRWKRLGRWRGLIVSALVFALVVVVVMRLLGGFGDLSTKERERIVEDAIRRAALTCFAVEGRYPGNVDYLKQNYGLLYDEDRCIVRYDAFSSNIMPDIRVIWMGESA